ncbi:MAG: hypothetical protein Q9200_002457 [Gallowayella weberi]
MDAALPAAMIVLNPAFHSCSCPQCQPPDTAMDLDPTLSTDTTEADASPTVTPLFTHNDWTAIYQFLLAYKDHLWITLGHELEDTQFHFRGDKISFQKLSDILEPTPEARAATAQEEARAAWSLRERATRTLEDTHAHISGEAEYQRGQFMKVAETQEAKKLAKMYLYHSSRWQSSYLQSGSLNHLLTLFNYMKKYLNANSKLLHQLRMSCIIRTRNAKLSRPNSSRSQRMQPADTVWAPRSSGKHRLEESDFESPQERKSKQQKSGFDSVLSPRDGEIDDVPRAADFEEPVYKNQLYLQALTKWALKPAQKGRDGLQHTSRQTRLVDMCRNDGSALKRELQLHYKCRAYIGDTTKASVNQEAVLIYLMGDVAKTECSGCISGNGPIYKCVVMEGVIKGVCANHHYQSESRKCSFG